MSLSIIAFLVLVAAFAIGSFTKINAGLLATVAAFGVGTLLAGMSIKDVIGQFPAGLFFILVGATLLFAIVRINGTIDLLAYWAERLAGDRKILVPVLMFLLTAALASAGAFTPAAIAIVAPVGLALGMRFGISTLAMGLVIVQGANAGAFSPVNPFGVLANKMLEDAGATDGSFKLYAYCFIFNAVLAAIAYVLVQAIMKRRAAKEQERLQAGEAQHDGGAAAPAVNGVPGPSGSGTAVLTAPAQTSVAAGSTTRTGPEKVAATPMRILTLVGIAALLVLTTVLGIDVGVASLIIATVLIVLDSGVQKPAVESMPWSAIILVTGIVTYVGMLEEMGALKELQEGIAGLGNSSLAALITSYVVAIVSAFASTTGTLGVISPVVAPIAMDPLLTPIGVVTAIAISSSVVDVSPMSTSGALLMASAQPKDERMFFRALLLWAIAMIAVVPLLVWFVFVQLGLG
ncbi:Na+/H+ antiporter NhaD/arsenite permease-like protein [Pseudarthrobacter oxydans]|uniref:Na+/H+ antiporter NhaD/arsenite permease-like protein n=1 Tax=Pseudarthrobacter oxydans TaxID=1671 RepID=A0AAW8NIS1_PSEOX|nr:SLC13 family permease [Pseudarthrobacter oxydans]MDR6794653.1 Na+/H+ antiporter NhaD/arsenite permease-like protein [Pseudarthrobacter oxydans]MDR7166007.1 Na+/H+ antiporter NhaD/arsenite permease-like protein [Pseudarthrobacter oxydans]